jgi:hypothetical protein
MLSKKDFINQLKATQKTLSTFQKNVEGLLFHLEGSAEREEVTTTQVDSIKEALSCLTPKGNKVTPTTNKVKARSGVEGVHAHPRGGWIGRVGSTYVGYFSTIAEAKEAIERKKVSLSNNYI